MSAFRSPRPARLAGAAALCAALVLSACTKSEDSGGGSTEGTGGAQVAETPEGEGPTCTLEQYGGKELDLANAVVGFSQSEKEANPFRIAETQSIKDEAKEVGVKQLLTTNANSQLSKQISDIQDMINKGAQALVVAPLNSDGLEPALAAARAKDIPVLTIDRKVNSEPCKDYVAFLGSNFVEQGKRAAQEMAKGLDNKGKVAILPGSSGNNVTTDRTKGFVDEMAEIAPDIEIVAQQTGEFARDKGQQVMEQIIQAQPDLNGVYAENDEMALGAGRSETAMAIAGALPLDGGEVTVGGKRLRTGSVAAAMRAGVVMLPEDRKADGILPELSVRENIALAALPRLSRTGLVSRRRQDSIVDTFMRRLRIKAASPDQRVGELSGGNQQKVLLARLLCTQPKVLLLDEPTRGIDVGAKAEVQALVDELAADGLGVVLISSEFDEVVEGSDAIVVLREGRVVARLEGDDVNEAALLAALAEESDDD
jgi:ribose transport system substrate-binding protein